MMDLTAIFLNASVVLPALCMHTMYVFDCCSLCCHLNFLTAAMSFLVVSSAVTMSAPFFLGKVIDTVYTNSSADFSASLTSLCMMLAGVFLCGGAANAARIYLIHVSGELLKKNHNAKAS